MTLAAAEGQTLRPAGRGAAMAIRGLTVACGDRPAVCDVNARFAVGAMTAIIGPNGAGKSTLLQASLGLGVILALAAIHGPRRKRVGRDVA